MRNRVKPRRVLDPLDEVVRQLAGRAARAISDADKVRHVLLQLADGLEEVLCRLGCFRREELEEEGWGILRHDIVNVHHWDGALSKRFSAKFIVRQSSSRS